MKIIGIETSCDDTGISIIEARGKKSPSFRIISNSIASQVKVHQQYGGVYPNLAKREHETNLPIVLSQVFKQVKMKKQDIDPHHLNLSVGVDAIAITVGPGLSPCLWVGINWAKTLAKKWGVPLIPVNHMEGHLLVSLFFQGNEKSEIRNPKSEKIFPAIALLVSGGHTQLVLVTSLGKYKILGETRDDAAGECFDKTARILGLPYPGGPAIAKEAEKTNFENVGVEDNYLSSTGEAPGHGRGLPQLPRPMIHTKDYDFSFSGLKTAVLYDWKSRSRKVRESAEYISEMAKEIQQAIIDVLITKTMRAAHEYNTKSIVLGGGVAANKELRRQLRYKIRDTKYKIQVLVAPRELCTDNGAMIAIAGYATWLRSEFKKQKHIEARPNLTL